MSKSRGSALGILALFIAIGAISLEVFNTYISPPQWDTGEEIGRTWTATYTDYFRTNPINTDLELSNLNVTFEVKTGQTVYLLYSGRAHLDLDYDGFTELKIYFSIDGDKISEPYIWERFYYNYSDIGGTSMLRTISLQYVNSTLSAGAHIVTIILEGNFGFNGVAQSSLYVQTYIS
ncbi:MAG: hypothetical protein ACXAB8_11105 [Promethearchaeota archaeon]|jgi:hypothetical protein